MNEAPALPNSKASLPLEIPPQPTKTKPVPFVCFRRILNAASDNSFKGLPESPPVWLTKSELVVNSLSVGLWIVVFDNMIPSTFACTAELAIDSISGSDKSGATLTSMGGFAPSKLVPNTLRSVTTDFNNFVSLASFWRSLKPGVFGDETLTIKTSAYGPNLDTP
ncbi:conserved hypothetical protein [Lodderomyces elongisporus NRRL YB-4239]|uniref:Uncharacterized protein n=1 Tax=Lodderomyces elongisporus (strain ATCC 11503 / CBS 2605 / JCM 1781 / NBRC 1676 / NRRL YB-4239) TaxID=379508 RepID=A5DT45_LODEL|nr:conserved hypothetical protein [Lodderomyces elongisporus NRRL YB-4239]